MPISYSTEYRLEQIVINLTIIIPLTLMLLLINLLDSYGYKFDNPTENNLSELYQEIQEEENICYFGFSEVIKFMPFDTIIKNDDFKDQDTWIQYQIEIYD